MKYGIVFIQLNLKERLNCMLVCRTWWSLIDEYSLLYDVEIVNSVYYFNRFMDMLYRSPHRAAQVEKLILRNSVSFDFDQRSLCSTFHNAQLFEMKNSEEHLETFTRFNEPFDMVHAKTKTRILTDSLHCDLTSQLLTSDLCGALHTLVLDFPSEEGDTRGQAIVAQMVNLPVLRSLTLARLNIGIHGLDTLHQNVPSIQEFKLDGVCILDSKAPSDIIPAASLTSLDIHIDLVDNLGTHIQLYKYMTKKYINLTRTKYFDDSLGQYDTNLMVGFYSDALLGFIQLIGPTTKSLPISNLPPGINVFRPLDATQSRVEFFSFNRCDDGSLLEDFTHSDQFKYVKALNFTRTNVDSPRFLQDMPLLTSLSLVGLDEVNLSEYLNAFPETVKRLSVMCTILNLDINTTRSSSIQNLFINCNVPSNDLGTLISEKFPNLVNLKLISLIPNHMPITLPRGHPLQTILFRTKRQYPDGHGFVFDRFDQTSYYFCGGGTILTTKQAIENLSWLTFKTYENFKLEICDDNIDIRLSRELE